MPHLINPSEKIILALDGLNESEVFSLVEKLPKLLWVKVGLELFTLLGPKVIEELKDKGKKIFLDLKFHDIPQTMSSACYQAAKTGAQLITVHACSGEKALKFSNDAAVKGAQEIGLPPPTLLAVTVLTSWSSKSFVDDLGINDSIPNRVNLLADLAYKSGIGGCVCSPLEVEQLRNKYPLPFELITPGIRSLGDSLNDQTRVMTPAKAIGSGASRLVVGRSITRANYPEKIFEDYYNQLII